MLPPHSYEKDKKDGAGRGNWGKETETAECVTRALFVTLCVLHLTPAPLACHCQQGRRQGGEG